jgi:hypothetical protein
VTPAFAQSNIIFDVPGAVSTLAKAINTNGDVAGCYTTGTTKCHGFLRTSDGVITAFDVPGSTDTTVFNMNDQGAIAGTWGDQNLIGHGFVRSPGGVITTFDPPDASVTNSAFISNNSSIGGAYQSSQSPALGYIRSSDGTFTTFSAPNGLVLQSVNGINATGDITGTLSATTLYVRHSDGSFSTRYFAPVANVIPRKSPFDAVSGINSSDQVVGTNETFVALPYPTTYYITEPFVWDGRNVTTFDKSQGLTYGVAINDPGEILGKQLNQDLKTYVGFLRDTNGAITTFQVGSVSTEPTGINNSGVICGSTITSSSNPNFEGFLRIP